MKYESAVELKRSLLSGKISEKIPTIESLPTTTTTIKSARATEGTIESSPLAIGISFKNGEYRIAARVQTATPGVESALQVIAKESKGEFDVKVVGRVLKQSNTWHRKKNRPLLMGSSIAHKDVSAGTLGAFVSIGERDFILSNNHVLANENQGAVGDSILQPGFADGGNLIDGAAQLHSYIPLKLTNNIVDAAIATISEDMEYYYGWLDGFGGVVGVRDTPLEEMETVFKLGRTTGLTTGRVSATEIDDLVVGFDIADLSFDNQIEIEPIDEGTPFSLGGDSGSLIVDENMMAIGLLFAGNDVDATYVNPIAPVLDAFGAEMLPVD